MVTRRIFLQTSAAVAAGLAGLACGGPSTSKNPHQPDHVPANPILVLVNIDGGYDWLNVLVPTAGASAAAYQNLRPTLRIDPGATTDLGGGVGLNNDLSGLAELHAKGHVAWIPGIGMPNFSLSHFTAGDLWAQGAAVPAGTGWLGRFADGAFTPGGDVLRGITVTSDLPLMLKGAERAFVSITSGSGYVFPSKLAGNALGAGFEPALLENGTIAAVQPGLGGAGYQTAAAAMKMFLDAQNSFGTNGQLPARTPAALYPGDAAYPITKLDGGRLTGGLSNQLKLIAQMIAAELPGEVYFARLGGWDTHSNQAVDHPNLQRALGGSIQAFWEDLATITTAAGLAQDRVMILAYSEFGRRVKENNGGTDHGTAGMSFCLSKSVRGGLYGAYPDLTSLDGNGNMKYSASADFRSLYATVLEKWLGRPASTVDGLLGAAYPRMGFL